MLTKTRRDRRLFDKKRVRAEFLCMLRACDAEQQRRYLAALGYYGCVGDAHVAENTAAVEAFVATVRARERIDRMYRFAIEFFAAVAQQQRDDAGALWRPAPLATLNVGRATAANDWHYVMRGRLYGFSDALLGAMSFAGVVVAHRCQHCGARHVPLARCTGCGDAFYCGAQCQALDWVAHARYCHESSETQRLLLI